MGGTTFPPSTAYVFSSHHRSIFWNYILPDTMVLEENPIERVCQWFQRLFPCLRLQFTLPYRDTVPSHWSELMLHLSVALLVPPNLCYPEVTIRLRNLATPGIFNLYSMQLHIVSMPKTPIYKDASPIFPHHDIRLPWQSWMVQPIAEPMSP